MAAYIDKGYYDAVYLGRPVPSADFPRLALRATEQIDATTFRAVANAGLASLRPEVQAAVKNATCAIVEGLAALEAHSDNGVISTSESASGAYSYSVDADSIKSILPNALNRARDLLDWTGLLYAGVSIR